MYAVPSCASPTSAKMLAQQLAPVAPSSSRRSARSSARPVSANAAASKAETPSATPKTTKPLNIVFVSAEARLGPVSQESNRKPPLTDNAQNHPPGL